MSLMRTRRALLPAAVIALSVAGPALAAGLSGSQASSAASQAALAVRSEVHAARVKVTGCSHASAGTFRCHAEARYTIGARRCTFEIVVKPPASKGLRPRTSPVNFVCY
jgi:hypothetical protein